nr:CBS domain-containing protein [Plastoroseomonas hellenica]
MTTSNISVAPSVPVADIVRLLADRGLSGVPVLDADGALLGMVTETDLLRRLAIADEPKPGWFRRLFADQDEAAERYARAHGATAGDVMTTELITVEEDSSVEHAAHLLEEHKVRRLPVLREGRLVGMVSRGDLLRALFPPAVATAAAPSSDDAIRTAIEAEMRRQAWADTPFLSIGVQDGVVELHGFHRSPATRRALSALIAEIPGVVRIDDRAVERPPVGMMAR